jgi:hypothetical protein
MPKKHGARPADTGSKPTTPQELQEIGITKDQSSKWQQIADIPEEKWLIMAK